MMKNIYHTLRISIFCLGLSQSTSALAQMESVNPIERDQNKNQNTFDNKTISDLENNADAVPLPRSQNRSNQTNNDDDRDTQDTDTRPFSERTLQRPERTPSQYDIPDAQDPLEEARDQNAPNDNDNTNNNNQVNGADPLQPDTIQADEGVDLDPNQDQNQDQDLAITPELRDSELDMRDNIPTDLVRANEPAPNGAGRRIQPLENGTVTRQRIDGRGEAPRTATSREQVPPFDPLGLPIGSFYLFPSLEVSETFTDNVFISATRKASDATTTIIPSLRLESNWNNHALEFSLGGSSTHHAKHKSQDSKGFNAGLRGRIDVTTQTNILGGASYSVTQETGSSIDFNTASVSPSDITTTSYFTELNHRFNRLSVRLRGTRDTSDFANAASVNGAVINNTDRNRTTDTVQTQLNYEFSPMLSVFLDNNFDWTNYLSAADDNQINRDNTKRFNAIGIRKEITPFLNGQFRVGNQMIDPKDNRLAKLNAIVFDASLTWTPTELTSITGNYATTFSETTQINSSATRTDQYQLIFQHQARDNLTLNGGFSLDTQTGAGNEIVTYLTTFGSEYRLNRNIYLTSLLSYTDYNSTTLNSDYEIKSAVIGVRLQH